MYEFNYHRPSSLDEARRLLRMADLPAAHSLLAVIDQEIDDLAKVVTDLQATRAAESPARWSAALQRSMCEND